MSAKNQYANLSLLLKALLPYILLLLTLTVVTALGSSYLLKEKLIEARQKHLADTQQQAYNEFKGLEHLLDQYALEIKKMMPTTAAEMQVSLAIHDAHIAAMITTPTNPQLTEPLKELLKKTQTTQSTYATIAKDQELGYSLVTCLRLDTNRYLILLHPLERPFLNELADRYNSHFYLFDNQGHLIANDQEASRYITRLDNTNLSKLQSGVQFTTVDNDSEPQLLSYSPLPLGSEGFFLLGTSESLSDIESLDRNHHLYLFGIIILSLIVCFSLFRSLLTQLFSPLNALLATYEKIKAGDFFARVEIDKNSRSQLVNLGLAYNQLLNLIDGKDKQLKLLTEQLQKMDDLKSHNQHLRKVNLELENRTVTLKEQNQEFSSLFQVTQTMVSSLDQRLLHERIIQALKDSLNCHICVLYIFRPGADNLMAAKVQGLYGVELKSITVELGKGLTGEAALNQKLTYAPDLSVLDAKPHYDSEVVQEGSLLSVPMTVQNRLIGVINLHHSKINGFSATAQQIAQAIANQAAIAIENARLYEKTKTLSATDELTGLSNRRQFQEYLLRELAQSRRHHNAFSILMIDIDHFKLYNDYHGHLKGDIVLKKVASLLLQNTRGVDLVARFGGEEFVLLLPKSAKDSSLAVAEKLRMCIEKEHFSGAENSQPGQRLTISIGISHFPGDSSDVYDLMNLADTALYEAKKQGRNKCIGWEPTMVGTEN